MLFQHVDGILFQVNISRFTFLKDVNLKKLFEEIGAKYLKCIWTGMKLMAFKHSDLIGYKVLLMLRCVCVCVR